MEVFGFPIAYNGEIKTIANNRKLIISKIQQYFCQDHWEDNSEKVEKIQKSFEWGVAFFKFWLP